jgi:hypothetical protein
MDAALSAVQAAYAAPDWPGKGTASAAPAHIVVSGTVTAGTGSADSMVYVTDTPLLYSSYPPVILEGTGILNASMPKSVLYIKNADVALGGDLTLTGGYATTGGRVIVDSGGIFTMNGGTISNNYGGRVGGVFVTGGTFIMTRGIICNNNGPHYGGGVRIDSGSFIKTGGTIYGITKEDATPEDPNLQNAAATGYGHAVYADSGSKWRNRTAGPGIDINSGIGTAGSEPWIP